MHRLYIGTRGNGYGEQSKIKQDQQYFATGATDAEAEPKDIDFKGLSSATIRHLVDFMYTGNTPTEVTPCNLAEVLAGADRLELADLKEWCQLELIRMMTAESVSDILTLANRHQCPGVKKVATDFVRDHFDDVAVTEGWARLTSGVDNGEAAKIAMNRPFEVQV